MPLALEAGAQDPSSQQTVDRQASQPIGDAGQRGGRRRRQRPPVDPSARWVDEGVLELAASDLHPDAVSADWRAGRDLARSIH